MSDRPLYNDGSSQFTNLQLKEFSDDEIKSRICNQIMGRWASANDGKGRLSFLSNGTGNIGSWIERFRNHSQGSHPVGSNDFSTDTYSIDQDTSDKSNNQAGAGTDTVDLRPVVRRTEMEFQEMNETQLHADVIRCCSEIHAAQTHPLGSYHMGTSNPDGDTWTSRGSFVNRHRATGATFSETIHLRQKTNFTGGGSNFGATGPSPMRALPSTNSPPGLKEMSDINIRNMYHSYGNALLGGYALNHFGDYKLVTGTTAPSPGTWVQVGGWTEQFTTVSNYRYSQGYTGTYSQGYSGPYAGTYNLYYGGVRFGGSFTGFYTGTYSSGFTGYYSTHFVGLTVNPGAGNATDRSAPSNNQDTQQYTFWRRTA